TNAPGKKKPFLISLLFQPAWQIGSELDGHAGTPPTPLTWRLGPGRTTPHARAFFLSCLGGRTALIAPTVIPPDIVHFDSLVMLAFPSQLFVEPLSHCPRRRPRAARLLR